MYVDGAMKFANWWNMKYKCKFSKTSIVINELGGIYFTYFMTYFLLVLNLSLLPTFLYVHNMSMYYFYLFMNNFLLACFSN